MDKFKIEIASVPDRDTLVAEIWHEESLIAEVNRENGKLEIELYPTQKAVFNLNDFLSALETARNKLHD